MSKKRIDSTYDLDVLKLQEAATMSHPAEEDFNRQYDLTPVSADGRGYHAEDPTAAAGGGRTGKTQQQKRRSSKRNVESVRQRKSNRGFDRNSRQDSGIHQASSPSYPVDPWEIESPNVSQDGQKFNSGVFFPSALSQSSGIGSVEEYEDEMPSENGDPDNDPPNDGDGENDNNHEHRELTQPARRTGGLTFLKPSDIHPRMEEKEDEIQHLRLLAGKLNADWGAQDFMAPALARRIRDFQFAQEKRRKKYGDEKPFGILGLYEHLASIRVDVEWAEDAALRRANGEPYLSWADFDASKKNGVNRPFFTYFLLFTCSIALVASIALNGWVFEPLDVNPMIGPSAETLIRMGAKDSYLIVVENQVWRLISSAILHAGLVHYFVNCLALRFVGGAIETTHGSLAAGLLFGIPAIGGTILSAIFLPEYITVGASGGIFGLIGACLADIMTNWKHLFSDFVTENGKRGRHIMVVVFLFLDIALNCLIGLTPYVDNFTHLGGLVYGFLIGLTTMERLKGEFFGLQENWWSQTKQIITRFLGLIISLILIIITAVILLGGNGESIPCPNCMWLSCVPFPPWESPGNKWWYCDDCGTVTAEIVEKPSLHLQLDCPDGTNVAVGLDEAEELNRQGLIDALPQYCRDFCPTDMGARRY